jgi:hypothetical protein
MSNSKSVLTRYILAGSIGLIAFIVLVWSLMRGQSQAQMVISEAKEMAGVEFVVVSGHNDKTGTLFPLGLDSAATKTFRTFDPCTDEQEKLKIGDKIKFEFGGDKPVGKYRQDLPNCYLLIVRKE